MRVARDKKGCLDFVVFALISNAEAAVYVIFDTCFACTVNVTGETLVLNKTFPSIKLERLGTARVCWEQSCLAPEFHQSCLQCSLL